MSILNIDFETRSTVNLRRTGVYPYAEHPSTDVWCLAYAFSGDDTVRLWKMGEPVPAEIADQIRDVELHAWNAQFERIIWREILSKRYGWPEPELEQYVDTAAAAAALALPRGLGDAARVLAVPMQKDDEGHRLMLRMARPRSVRDGQIVWWTDADKLERLYEYCKQDVRAERAIAERIRPLSESERRVYYADQRMNDRGVRIDVPLVKAAKRLIDEANRRANIELYDVTGGSVDGVTKVADLTRWINERGIDTDNIRKDTVRDLLAGEGTPLPDDVQRALQLRADTAKSSTGKLDAFLDALCADNRVRGGFLYHGASTGRWSALRVQPQNFPRPGDIDPDAYIDRVTAGQYDLIDIERPVAVVVSSMLRAMMVPAPGHHFLSADYSQIEARVVAWIAEQEDLVTLFRNRGKVYETMAAYIFKRAVDEIEKDSFERQIGKNTVLGCGFQMGWRKFQATVKKDTGIDLTDAEAKQAVRGYRELYLKIVAFWWAINDAAKGAVQKPGQLTSCGRNGAIRFVVRGQFLWCILPSGRPLAYALPRIEEIERTFLDDDGNEVTKRYESVTFSTVDSMTKKWVRRAGYGGYWTENVVQAMARDLMAASMLRLEEAGQHPVLTVHDELVCEVPDGSGFTLDDMLALMTTTPAWADNLPVAAEGWKGLRYRK